MGGIKLKALKVKISVFSAFILLMVFFMTGCTNTTAALAEAADATDGQKQPASIQELVDNAKDNDEIIIPSGTYVITGPLTIEDAKGLKIRGDGEVRIEGENIDKQVIILKNCENIVIENIRAYHRRDPGADAVSGFDRRLGSVADVEECSGISFVNCELEGCGVYGIYAVNSQVTATGCYIHHNSWKAFGLYGRSVLTVIDSTITNNADLLEKDREANIIYEGGNIIKLNTKDGYETR